MLYVLILLLIMLLYIAYKTSNKEICSPAVLFIMPFIFMCIVAVFFQRQWSFKLELNTFIVVFVGNLSFFMGTKLANKIYLRKFIKQDKIEKKLIIKNYIFFFMLIFQIICYRIKIIYIINYGVSHGIDNNLSKCLVYYNNVLKFTTNETIKFPFWLTIGLDICSVFSFLCACVLAYQIIFKKTKFFSKILIILNYVVAVIGGLSSGGRGGAIQPLIAFICAFLILYQRKNNWRKPISLKLVVEIIVMLLGIIFFFYISLTWIGRNDVHMIGRYLSNYIGAQIFNLNYLLNSEYEYSEILGQQTFYPLIQKISSILGISKWSNYYVGDSNIYEAGYNTGNVQTCFYPYIIDFGFLGVIILPYIFGTFSQILYRFARNSYYKNPINFGLIVYSYFSYSIAFSFFADKFGSIIFTFNMLKRIILLYILYFILFKIKINKQDIVIPKKELNIK